MNDTGAEKQIIMNKNMGITVEVLFYKNNFKKRYVACMYSNTLYVLRFQLLVGVQYLFQSMFVTLAGSNWLPLFPRIN